MVPVVFFTALIPSPLVIGYFPDPAGLNSHFEIKVSLQESSDFQHGRTVPSNPFAVSASCQCWHPSVILLSFLKVYLPPEQRLEVEASTFISGPSMPLSHGSLLGIFHLPSGTHLVLLRMGRGWKVCYHLPKDLVIYFLDFSFFENRGHPSLIHPTSNVEPDCKGITRYQALSILLLQHR